MTLNDTKLDKVEEVFRANITEVIALLKVATTTMGDADDLNAAGAAFMSGLYQGLVIGTLDPKSAQAFIEVYTRRVWSDRDREALNTHLDVEEIIAKVRRAIGSDA